MNDMSYENDRDRRSQPLFSHSCNSNSAFLKPLDELIENALIYFKCDLHRDGSPWGFLFMLMYDAHDIPVEFRDRREREHKLPRNIFEFKRHRNNHGLHYAEVSNKFI